MRFQYDKGGKWLIEHHADAILKLAGIGPVVSCKVLPGELVQSRQLPDGMVEARLANRSDPVLCLIEINTYSYSATANELLDDVLLTYLNRRIVPEVIALTLSTKDNIRISPDVRLTSPLGHTRLEAGWRVVNLWELNASDFLPITDPGFAPWLPLTKIDGPPESVLQQCKDVIEAKTSGGERDNLLNVTEILAGLRFDKVMLRALFRRGAHMIESPVLQEWFAERDIKTRQTIILESLETRFGNPVPPDVSAAVRVIADENRLKQLLPLVYSSASLDAFRQVLTPPQTPATN
ncbi:MAG: hypothetical protein L0241_06805 [Planctomycetia bacterium]|nr:hypothetical protein [Planctomycetia bacterium]